MNFSSGDDRRDDEVAEDEKGESSEGQPNAAATSLMSSMAHGSLDPSAGANLSAAQQALLLASSNRNTGINTDRSLLEIAMLQRMRASNTSTQGYLGLGSNPMPISLLPSQQQLQQSHSITGGQDLSQLREARIQLLRQQMFQQQLGQQLGQQHQRNMQLMPYLSNASQLGPPALSQHQQNLQMAMSRSNMANARAAMAARNYDSGLIMRDMHMAARSGQSFPQAQHQPNAFGGASVLSSYTSTLNSNLPFASLQHATQARDFTSLSASALGSSEATAARGSPASAGAPQADERPEMQDAEYFELFGFNDEDGVQIINETFPHKLYRMLFEVERKGLEDIVCFFPHGKVFIVKDPKRFVGKPIIIPQQR